MATNPELNVPMQYEPIQKADETLKGEEVKDTPA